MSEQEIRLEIAKAAIAAGWMPGDVLNHLIAISELVLKHNPTEADPDETA